MLLDFARTLDSTDRGIVLGACYSRTNAILEAEEKGISPTDKLEEVYKGRIEPLIIKYQPTNREELRKTFLRL